MTLTRKVHCLFILFAMITTTLVMSQNVQARPTMEEQSQKAVVARDLILQRKYAEAEDYLKKVVADWPEELLGYFGLLSLFQIRNLDNYDYRFDPPYLSWEKKGRDMALQIARNPANAEAWDLLLAGATLNVTGFYRAHNHKWLPAMRDGSLGFHTYEKALSKDAGLSDALLGTGLYDYWRSHYTRKLRFLPFFADRRQEGKAALEKAVKEAHLTNVLAEIGLAYIDFQEKNFDQVVSTMDKMLARYPGNTILRMLKGEALSQQKKYAEAVAEFEKVLALDPKLTKSYLLMGVALAGEGQNREKARELLLKFLSLEPDASEDWRKLAEDTLKKIEK